MPPLRPPTHLSRPPSLFFSHPTRYSSLPLPRPFSASRTLASTHPPDVSEHPSPDTASHESHYDPPSGWLFGVPPGEKYKNEGWENTWVYGFWGSLALGVVAYAYKPDTSIQTWALEEARRRLEAEGILPDPDDELKK
ncbi:ESSS subunit of NADH:ubiquinone oxidoreductase-domain-containing protein [Usnea florida]